MPASQSEAITTSTPETVEEADRLGRAGAQHDGDTRAATVVQDPHAAVQPGPVRVRDQRLGRSHPGTGAGREQQALGGHRVVTGRSPGGHRKATSYSCVSWESEATPL